MTKKLQSLLYCLIMSTVTVGQRKNEKIDIVRYS